MNKKALQADGLLLLTACIWGFAFVPQKTSMEHIGPFTYNSIRFLVGSLSLLPLIYFRARKTIQDTTQKKLSLKDMLCFSAAAGILLFMAVSFQQIGIIYISPGNSGFITGMYVVFVPVFGIFLGKKTGLPTWIGAAMAFIGLFFVSVAANIEEFSSATFLSSIAAELRAINKGDALTLVGSFFWTCHVLIIDAAVKKVDAVQLSAGQFVVCGLLSLAAAALDVSALTGARGEVEMFAALDSGIKLLGPELFSANWSFNALSGGIVQLLYGSFLSVGVAYTLQAVAQKSAPPAHATIILCLESVFAAVGGILLASELINGAKLAGFALMFGGMLATQWDVIKPGRLK